MSEKENSGFAGNPLLLLDEPIKGFFFLKLFFNFNVSSDKSKGKRVVSYLCKIIP